MREIVDATIIFRTGSRAIHCYKNCVLHCFNARVIMFVKLLHSYKRCRYSVCYLDILLFFIQTATVTILSCYSTVARCNCYGETFLDTLLLLFYVMFLLWFTVLREGVGNGGGDDGVEYRLWCPLSIGGHGKSMMARVMIVEDEE